MFNQTLISDKMSRNLIIVYLLKKEFLDISTRKKIIIKCDLPIQRNLKSIIDN